MLSLMDLITGALGAIGHLLAGFLKVLAAIFLSAHPF